MTGTVLRGRRALWSRCMSGLHALVPGGHSVRVPPGILFPGSAVLCVLRSPSVADGEPRAAEEPAKRCQAPGHDMSLTAAPPILSVLLRSIPPALSLLH
mmetsp:Transcript_41094/g.66588  ORF Transcript_41094/g.66588 Transcript_41094/m.66588 type:complete len:99 (-) Transcript_41094:47-343(-)